MGRPRNPENPPCGRCGAVATVSKGREKGRQRWRCLACGRSFRQSLGTPRYRLKTDPAEIVRGLQVVLHRGSLRAAEEQTGHNVLKGYSQATSPVLVRGPTWWGGRLEWRGQLAEVASSEFPGRLGVAEYPVWPDS